MTCGIDNIFESVLNPSAEGSNTDRSHPKREIYIQETMDRSHGWEKETTKRSQFKPTCPAHNYTSNNNFDLSKT